MDFRRNQSFVNFEKAFLLLKDALRRKNLSELEKAGVVHYFEFTFELGWKTLKDYLLIKGVDQATPFFIKTLGNQ
ncbi:nucleotidyltransferase substrate binding protein [Tenuifilum osseticum]|uniref:nucleotidyltransferase substrate binding protein n=1 Tax=Tenuifilum osseticum TaxID=3374723 RepID=UPI0034E4CFF2